MVFNFSRSKSTQRQVASESLSDQTSAISEHMASQYENIEHSSQESRRGQRLSSLAYSVLGVLGFSLALTATSPSMATDELKGVTLRIAVDPMASPYTFLDNTYTGIYGIDIDIIHELQKRLGFSLSENRVFPLTTGYEIAALQRGEFDMIGGCLCLTEDRQKFMDFSPVYYDTGMSMMYSSKYNTNVKDMSSFNSSSKKIVTVSGTSGVQLVHERMDKAQVIETDNFTLAVFMVAKGEADGLIYQRPLLVNLTQALSGYSLELTPEVLDRAYGQIAFGFPRNSQYANHINRELSLMLIDGTIKQIVKKYMDNPVAMQSVDLATEKAKQYLKDNNLGHLISNYEPQGAGAADSFAQESVVTANLTNEQAQARDKQGATPFNTPKLNDAELNLDRS